MKLILLIIKSFKITEKNAEIKRKEVIACKRKTSRATHTTETLRRKKKYIIEAE